MIPDQQFTFDNNTGVVRGPSDTPYTVGARQIASWTVCEHLRSTLHAQLTARVRIVHVTGPGSWSKIDLDVSLDRVDMSGLPDGETFPGALDFWTNTDPHYPLQSGVSCSGCRQTLSWPSAR